MAKFKMVLMGSQRVEVNSKKVNDLKLNWFVQEILKIEQDLGEESFIKIYIGAKKKFEYYLSKENIDNLCLTWINYKEFK